MMSNDNDAISEHQRLIQAVRNSCDSQFNLLCWLRAEFPKFKFGLRSPSAGHVDVCTVGDDIQDEDILEVRRIIDQQPVDTQFNIVVYDDLGVR
jgi:hypothetical protein